MPQVRLDRIANRGTHMRLQTSEILDCLRCKYNLMTHSGYMLARISGQVKPSPSRGSGAEVVERRLHERPEVPLGGERVAGAAQRESGRVSSGMLSGLREADAPVWERPRSVPYLRGLRGRPS